MVSRRPTLSTQIVQEIVSAICCGQLIGDDGLSSETELAQRHGVSRSTVREALSRLEAGGAIVRRHGVGTFVSPMALGHRNALQGWFAEVPNFLDVIRAAGYQQGCKLLSIASEAAGPIADHLRIDPQSQVVCYRRIFYADFLPIIYSIDYVPLELVDPGYRETIYTEHKYVESTYDFALEYCGREVVYQEAQVRAVSADQELATLLQCSAGDPLLQSEDTGFALDILPLWHGLYWYRSDRVSFGHMGNPKLIVS